MMCLDPLQFRTTKTYSNTISGQQRDNINGEFERNLAPRSAVNSLFQVAA